MPQVADEQLLKRVEHHAQLNSMPMALVVPFTLYNWEPADCAAIVATMPGFVINVVMPILWGVQWVPMEPFLLPF